MTGPSVEQVKAEALRIGFVACGVAPRSRREGGDTLDRWLAAGYGGTMRKLCSTSQPRKRKHPGLVTPGARSAIVVLETRPPSDERPRAGDAFKITACAHEIDCMHVVTLGRLHILAEWLKARSTEQAAHAWVDDGPVPDGRLPERAAYRLGSSDPMLIHPRIGSYTFRRVGVHGSRARAGAVGTNQVSADPARGASTPARPARLLTGY